MNSYSKQLIDEEDIQAVVSALRSEYLTGGETAQLFEKKLAEFVGAKYCVVFSSGTAALHGSYAAIGLQEADEFITTPLTFVATANAGVYLGAKPRFSDITYNGHLDPKKIEEQITKKTKLIVPVDFAGTPCAIETIMEIAKKRDLLVIEDASHALGSKVGEKRVGSLADMSVFSFHPVKPITTFEGGAVTTDSKEFYEKLKLFRSHGIVKKDLWNQDMISLGYNYRLSDVACALGISQLQKLDKFITKRTEIARVYDEALQDVAGIYTLKVPIKTTSSYHLYPILLERDLWCAKEDIFRELLKRGIGVQVHYKPVYQHSFYRKKIEAVCNNAEEFYRAEISIPCHQGMSLEDAYSVVKNLKEVVSMSRGCKA